MAKYTASASGHLSKHYERDKGADGEYIKFGNQNIDPSKTPENYNLAPDREGGQVAFIKQRLSEVKVQKRDDVNVLCDWVVTLPKGAYTQEQERAFFAETYRFLSEKYDEKNVVSAFVHKDETQPHLHFAFIPVVADRKWNEKHPDKPREKVSVKELVQRQDYREFHPQFQAHLDKAFNKPDLFPVLNGATAGGNRTISELQAEIEIGEYQYEVDAWRTEAEIGQEAVQALEHKANTTRQSLSEAREELEAVKGDVTTLQAEKTALQSEIGGLRGILAGLRDKIAELKDTAAAKLLRVQERLDRTLRRMPEQSSQDFKREWAQTKEVTIEQAVKPKQKGWER